MREAAKTLGKKLIMLGSCFLTAVFFYVSIVKAETLPHLEKEILPELYISADIDVPKELSGEMAKTINVKRKTFTVEQVEKILWTGKKTVKRDIETDYQEADIGRYEITTLYGEDDSFLDVGGAALTFYNSLYNNLCNAVQTNPMTSSYNLDKFTEQELEFMPRTECEEKIRDLLSLLGVSFSSDMRCYALDAATLQNEERAIDVDGNRQEEMEKGIWTAEDECYYFQLSQEFNGVNVFENGYGDYFSGIGIPPTKIEAIYGAKGLVYLNILNAYDTINGTEKSEKIQNIDDLENELKKKYELLIRSACDKVTDIKMQYIPYNSDNYSFSFVPAWIVRIETPVEGMDNYTMDLLFHAITGKELF